MPRRLTPTLLCLAALALTGCMKVGPDFKRPVTASPQAWLEADYAKSRPDLPMHDDWWKQLNDPVLDGLVALARQQNLTVQAAGARILEARAELGISVGELYPQTQQGVGGYTYTQASQSSPTAPQPGKQAGTQWIFWQNNLGLQAAWELDFWGKYRRAAESDSATLAATVADYDNALVTLASDVATYYVQLRVGEERLRIANTNAKLEREALGIAEIRFELGATSERDVMQAKTLLESTEATIPQFEAAIQKAHHALALLLGVAPSNLADLLGKDSHIPVCPEGMGLGIPADLLRRRPDVRSAEYQAAAQCARIGVAKAELFPSFSLTGNVGWLSSNVGAFKLQDILKAKTTTAGFGPGVTWNLFNYGQIVNNVRVQDARFEQAILGYRNSVLTALKEVEDGLSDFQGAKGQAARLTVAVDAATRGAELAFLQYREGKTDFTTVIVAQRDQLNEQDSLAQVQGNIVLGMVGTYRALGGGWEVLRGTEVVPSQVKDEMAKRTWWGPMLKVDPAKNDDPAKGGPSRYLPDF